MSHIFLDTASLDVLTVIRYIWAGDKQQEMTNYTHFNYEGISKQVQTLVYIPT